MCGGFHTILLLLPSSELASDADILLVLVRAFLVELESERVEQAPPTSHDVVVEPHDAELLPVGVVVGRGHSAEPPTVRLGQNQDQTYNKYSTWGMSL